MAFLEWLEFSALASWVGGSLWGYPIMLGLHAVGLGVVVGVLAMVDLRVAGCFSKLEMVPLKGFIKIAWAGFVVNFISGFSLFAAQATYFITHKAFIIKIIAIFLAIINAALLQNMLRQNAQSWDGGAAIPMNAKLLAISSLILWSVAMVAGRLIAYIY